MNETTLDKIKEYARLQFTVDQVETVCDLKDGIIEGSNEASNAYLAGRLQAQAEIRQALMDDITENRNTQAAKTMLQIAEETEPEYVEEG